MIGFTQSRKGARKNEFLKVSGLQNCNSYFFPYKYKIFCGMAALRETHSMY
jgi:hypothetical protein